MTFSSSPGKHVETGIQFAEMTTDLSQPVVLEQNGDPVAVLLSVEEFQRYQEVLASKQPISASEARGAANQAVFGDLVGAALACGEPVWAPQPSPQWRIPYRLFDGSLLRIVAVDAYTGAVSLTEEERSELLKQVRQWSESAGATFSNPS